MTTALLPDSDDRCVILRDVSWTTYESLLRELQGQHVFLTYDRGTLEIMSPSPRHAKIGKFIGRLIETFTLELQIPIVALGNTTWKRPGLGRGAEGDECYYIAHAEWAKSREEFDLDIDPPPDLVVEVDVANSTLNKDEIYADLKVPELWRYAADTLVFLHLDSSGGYQRRDRSFNLPMLPPQVVEDFVRRRNSADDTTLMSEFRKWINERFPKS